MIQKLLRPLYFTRSSALLGTDNQQSIQKGFQLIKDLASTTIVNASPSSDSDSIDDDDEAAFFSTYHARSTNHDVLEQYLVSKSEGTVSSYKHTVAF